MNREKEIYKVTLVGGVVNVLLLAFKFVAGIVAHSSAMVADALHSLSDFVTDIIVLVFVKISNKPQDKSHDYGHGKFETLAMTVIGVALVAVALGIIVKGATKIAAWANGEVLVPPGMLAFWAAIVSIVLKEAVYRYSIIRAKKLNSKAVEANAWHHRSDALSSIGTAIGIGGAIFLGERWTILDPIASVVVGAFIIKVAFDLLKNGIGDLMEQSLPDEVENEILDLVSGIPGVSKPHELRTRRIGNHYAIELHVMMDGDLSLREAHNKATEIEDALRQHYGEETHVAVHVEPMEEQVDLAAYMSNGITSIMTRAYKNVLSNPREAKFAYQMQRVFQNSERKRKRINEKENINVPPFLICSIATICNLHCKGCYARANGIANDGDKYKNPLLTPEQWQHIFNEAAELGVCFSLLAGGEPLMRRDILEAVAGVKDMIFPIFTNGTLIGTTYIDFFRKHLNLIPIISIEGTALSTDNRRGQGVFERAISAMQKLKAEDLFFGTSITVTTENYHYVTSTEFLDQLRDFGCKLVFFVEYVPSEPGTEHLAFTEDHVTEMERLLEQQRAAYSDIIFLSFPGDEKEAGGCLASGRGFFHIGPDGSAEPCPFAPYSDSNVREMGLKKALQSPLFRKLRDANALNWQHTGGCTLWEHREEVEQMMQ